MRAQAVVELAAELLRRLLRFDAPADSVVSAFFRAQRGLGPRERHTLAETAYAVLRRRLLFQHLAQSGRGPLERRLVLLGWQGDDAFLGSALEDGESAWLAHCRSLDPVGLPDKLRHNLPDWLAGTLRTELGAEAFAALSEALLQPAPLDLRVNMLKAKREAVQRELAEAGIEALPTPYSPWGPAGRGRRPRAPCRQLLGRRRRRGGGADRQQGSRRGGGAQTPRPDQGHGGGGIGAFDHADRPVLRDREAAGPAGHGG